jgi:phosphoadenosine phosphosulfate reductase
MPLETDDPVASLQSLPPAELIAAAFARWGDRLALTCSFGGAGGLVLLDMAMKVSKKIPVLVLDTDFLFPETYATLEHAERTYGITVERIKARHTPAEQEAIHGPALWSRRPDLCCNLRKVEPFRDALAGRFDAWITAIRRDQSGTRAGTGTVELDAELKIYKLAPLATWTEEQVWSHVREIGIGINPLLMEGYTSIGCTHCTRKPTTDDPRSGRWSGFVKVECGLHARPTNHG